MTTHHFIAVCAFVGRGTNVDGRMLGAPYRTDDLRMGAKTRRIMLRLEGQADPVQVGTIDYAGLIGDQVVLTGTLAQEGLAKRLRSQKSVLTLDVNGPRTTFREDAGRVIAEDWEIAAAQFSDAHTAPWYLPAPLVWSTP